MAHVPVPTRRAVALTAHGDPPVMEVVAEPTPPTPEGHVPIAVEAIGVNFGDTLLRRGRYVRGAPLSIRPGFEVAGTVVGDHGAWRHGERVAAYVDHGGYATAVSVPAERLQRVPVGLSTVQAAGTLIQGLTAWFACFAFGELAAGERVLVHAAGGGVGALCVQLAQHAGATVFATASTPDKRERARELGAAVALDSRADDLAEQVRRAVGEHGVDVVLDGVGGPVLASGFDALATGGRYVVLGAASQQPSKVDLRRLMFGTKRICGFVLGDLERLRPGASAAAFAELAERLADGRLEHPVRDLPLDRVVEAHEILEGRSFAGKLVLTP